MFLDVSIVNSLQWCLFWVHNIDKLVIIYKIWLIDAWVDYKLISGDKLLSFLFVQHAMLEENEDLREKVAYFENKEWLWGC